MAQSLSHSSSFHLPLSPSYFDFHYCSLLSFAFFFPCIVMLVYIRPLESSGQLYQFPDFGLQVCVLDSILYTSVSWLWTPAPIVALVVLRSRHYLVPIHLVNTALLIGYEPRPLCHSSCLCVLSHLCHLCHCATVPLILCPGHPCATPSTFPSS